MVIITIEWLISSVNFEIKIFQFRSKNYPLERKRRDEKIISYPPVFQKKMQLFQARKLILDCSSYSAAETLAISTTSNV